MKWPIVPTLALAGCATMPPPAAVLAPMEAIERAAAAAPAAAPAEVPGMFRLTVRGVGRQDGNLYLNSEADYRDQRSLTIAVRPVAQGQLENRLGAPTDEALLNRTIRVAGAARCVRIDFMHDGRPTGKYYYQTHVVVTRSDQLLAID